MIPPGEPITPLEKLLLPFSRTVWIWIAITITIGVSIIRVVKFLPRKVQNFVFGSNVATPSINLLIAIMGGSQTVLPRRNFARFLLMLMLIWSLTMRSCYQGQLYKHLQSDKRKPEIKTIEEMIERNFTLYESYQNAYVLATYEQRLRWVKSK